jgi:hypothetical protein
MASALNARKCSVVVPANKEETSTRHSSPDRTGEVILAEINRNDRIGSVALSQRFGQPAATLAGTLSCTGDASVGIDVDLFQRIPEV